MTEYSFILTEKFNLFVYLLLIITIIITIGVIKSNQTVFKLLFAAQINMSILALTII